MLPLPSRSSHSSSRPNSMMIGPKWLEEWFRGLRALGVQGREESELDWEAKAWEAKAWEGKMTWAWLGWAKVGH